MTALQRLTKIGVNCLRVSVQTTSTSLTGIGYVSNAGVRTSDEKKAQLDALLDTAVDNATKQGIYVIIDWGVLNENPNITIELSAHTDYRGSDEYNKALSQKRAETVVDYLIKKGIAADRLTPVGYGEEQPKKIRKKVAEHYPWLKEGDILTEEFITKLKPDQQETANALNRRTEFKVLRTTYDMFDEEGNMKNPPKPKPKKEEVEEEEGWFEF